MMLSRLYGARIANIVIQKIKNAIADMILCGNYREMIIGFALTERGQKNEQIH